MLRTCQPSDAPQVCQIYNHYVRETVITFEEAPVEELDMSRRISDVTKTSALVRLGAKRRDSRLCLCDGLESALGLSLFRREHGLFVTICCPSRNRNPVVPSAH